MYIYEALSHVTLTPCVGHSPQHATKGMGVIRNVGAVISNPSCCSELEMWTTVNTPNH